MKQILTIMFLVAGATIASQDANTIPGQFYFASLGIGVFVAGIYFITRR